MESLNFNPANIASLGKEWGSLYGREAEKALYHIILNAHKNLYELSEQLEGQADTREVQEALAVFGDAVRVIFKE